MEEQASQPTSDNVVVLRQTAPPGPELAGLLEQGYRIAVGLAAIAVAAASEVVARTLGTGPAEDEEVADEEPEPVHGLPLLLGAGIGAALGAARWGVRSAASLGRAVAPVASFATAPPLARRRLEGVQGRLAELNERWVGERPRTEEAADAFLRLLVPRLVNAALDRVDLTEIVLERVDLDRVVERVNVDAAAERIDVDRIVARVDLDRVLERVDLNELAARIDIERLIRRIDLDAIVDRVDLNRAVARVDLDAIAAGLDVDAVAARVDLDAIISRVDLVHLARDVIDAIDLPQIIRNSTGTMTTETIEGIRYQSMKADRLLSRLVDSLVRRGGQPEGEEPQGEEDLEDEDLEDEGR
jgi:hypothetical protein